MCSIKERTEPSPGGPPLAASLALAGTLFWAVHPAPAAARGPASERGTTAGLVGSAIEQPRFSDLDELTPQNVSQLLPLLAMRAASGGVQRTRSLTQTQLGSAATADAHLRDFVTWRATLVRAPGTRMAVRGSDSVVSFVVAGTRVVGRAGTQVVNDPGRLSAWDPVRRRVVWSAAATVPPGSGAVVTAGGLVFYCSTNGSLQALDAQTGERLWSHRLAAGEHGRPVTYLGADGHQYVGVVSDSGADSGALQTFSLPR